MTTVTMTKQFTLSDEAVVDILDGAFEGGINYWAQEGGYDKEAKTFFVVEDEDEGDGTRFDLTYLALVEAAAKIATGAVAINNQIRLAIVEAFEDYDNAVAMDAEAYDCIVQVACYSEIIYG